MLENKAGTGDGTRLETVLTKEYPLAHDETNDPYFSMPFGEGMAHYQHYKAMAEVEPRTLFPGRLATYSYPDMWMAAAQAMVKLRGWQRRENQGSGQGSTGGPPLWFYSLVRTGVWHFPVQ